MNDNDDKVVHLPRLGKVVEPAEAPRPPDNVVDWGGLTRLKTPPEKVLRDALEKHHLSEVVVLGFTDCGGLYFDSSYPDGPNVLWLFELTKRRLMKSAEDLADEDEFS